ncbi:transposase [Patescibacteria group bacterium]|nr:transposase [Patescibacteria group bacterium]
MIRYSVLSTKPKHFKRLTGLTLPEFAQVLDKFRSAYDLYKREERAKRSDWERKAGGGNTPKLKSLEDKLLFILVYVRMYPLWFIQGLLFDMAASNSCIWGNRLLPVLNNALGFAHVLPKRTRGRGLDELMREFPELKELGLLTDGVERPRRRPKDKDKQTSTYSGKKKRHTRKNVVITRPDTNEVLYLGETQDGKMHDKVMLDKEELAIHHCREGDKINLGADLGFLGLEIPGTKVIMPTKKPQGGELSDTQKGQNTTFSSIRIRVEHAIAGVKRNHSVADTYRNIKTNTDDLLMSIACGLHNLRVANRYLPSIAK